MWDTTELTGRIAARFPRPETRRTAPRMLTGLLSELPVKNCWTLAEQAGGSRPDAMQHLLADAVIGKAGLVEDLRGYVAEHLGSRDAVLVVDETANLKKGVKFLDRHFTPYAEHEVMP